MHMENNFVFRCHSVYLIAMELLPMDLELLDPCQSVALVLKGGCVPKCARLWGQELAWRGALQGTASAQHGKCKTLSQALGVSWECCCARTFQRNPREIPEKSQLSQLLLSVLGEVSFLDISQYIPKALPSLL